MPLIPILLVTHVMLAVGLLLPSVLLPFGLRAAGASSSAGASRAADRRLVRALVAVQEGGTTVLGAGVAITGVALAVLLGAQLFAQPWLRIAVALYGANLAIAFFIQRPGLRRLIGLRGRPPGGGDGGDAATDETRWRTLARRQRYVSYLMAALIGLIGFLMMSKPELG